MVTLRSSLRNTQELKMPLPRPLPQLPKLLQKKPKPLQKKPKPLQKKPKPLQKIPKLLPKKRILPKLLPKVSPNSLYIKKINTNPENVKGQFKELHDVVNLTRIEGQKVDNLENFDNYKTRLSNLVYINRNDMN
eukprot:Pgem_evm1s19250